MAEKNVEQVTTEPPVDYTEFDAAFESATAEVPEEDASQVTMGDLENMGENSVQEDLEDGSKGNRLNSNSAVDIINSSWLRTKQFFSSSGNQKDPMEEDREIGTDLIAAEEGEDIAEKNIGVFAADASDRFSTREDQVREILTNPESTPEQAAWAMRQIPLGLDVGSIFREDSLALAAEQVKKRDKILLNHAADPEAYPLDIAFQQSIMEEHLQIQKMFSGTKVGKSVVVSRNDEIKFQYNNIATKFVKSKIDVTKFGVKEWKEYTGAFVDEYMYQIMASFEFSHGLIDEDTKRDMEEFRKLRIQQRKKASLIGQNGAHHAMVGSLILDPFFDLGIPVAIAGVKLSRAIPVAQRVKSFNNTTGKLRKTLGDPQTLALARTSENTRVQYLDNLAPDKLEEVKKIVKKGKDAFSEQVREAIVKVEKGEVIVGPPEMKVSAGASQANAAKVSGEPDVIERLTEDILLVNNPDEVSNKAEAIRNSLRAGDALPLTMFPDVPYAPINNASTTFAEELNNAAIVSNTTGARSEWRVMQAEGYGDLFFGPTEKNVVANNFYLYNNELGIGPAAHAWSGLTGNKFLDITFAPFQNWKGVLREDFVIKPALNLKEQNRIRSVISKDLRSIYSPLVKNKVDFQNFQDLVVEGNDLGRNWSRTYGGVYIPGVKDSFRPAPLAVQDSISAYSRYHQDLGEMVNNSLNIQLRDKGVKYFKETQQAAFRMVGMDEGTKARDIFGNEVTWSKERAKVGDTLYVLSDSGTKGGDAVPTILTKQQVSEQLGEIPDSFKAMSTREGFHHIQYTEPYVVTQILTDEKGNIINQKTVSTARNRREANKLINDIEDIDQGIHYTAHRTGGGRTDMVVGQLMDNALKMTDMQFEEMMLKLAEGGKPDEYITAMRESRKKWGYRPQSFTKKRGERLLSAKSVRVDPDTGELVGEFAPVKTPDEAAASYGNKVARYTANVPHLERLKKGFLDNYGKYLTDSLNPFSLPSVDKASVNKISEITSIQRQLKNLEGRSRLLEQFIDSGASQFTDWMAKSKNPLVSVSGDLIHRFFPSPTGVLRGAGKVGRQTLMGVGAVIQMPLQFATAYRNILAVGGGEMISTAGRLVKGQPRKALQSTKAAAEIIGRTHTDFVQVMAPYAGLVDEITWTKRGRNLYDALQKSGYAAGVDFENVRVAFREPRIVNNLTAGWMKKGAKGAKDIFFNSAVIGEQMSQIFAWLGARNEIEIMVKQGRYPTLALGDVASNSNKFIEAVNRRTMEIMPNMSSANKAGMSSGDILGLLTMLKRFAFDELGFFANMSGKLKKRELAALYLGTAGALGIEGIPAVLEAEWLAEKGLNTFESGVPDAKGKLQFEYPLLALEQAREAAKDLGIKLPEVEKLYNLYSQGALNVASGNLVDLNSRLAAQSVYTSFLRGATFSENALGASYAVTKNIMKLKPSVTSILDSIDQFGLKEGVTSEAFIDSFMSLGEQLIDLPTGTAKMKQAFIAAKTGKIKTKTGQVIKVGATLDEVLVLAAGETPATVKRVQEYTFLIGEREKEVRGWMMGQAKHIAEVYSEGHFETAALLVDSVRFQLNDAGYALLGVTFQNMLVNQKLQKKMPAEIKSALEAVINPISTRDSRRIFRLLKQRN